MASLPLAPVSSNFNFSSGKRPALARSTVVQDPLRNSSPLPDDNNQFPGKLEADVVVIGSGIGGLCCAGLLAKYNQDVIVLESHDVPGGAAHSFEIKGYKFDSGPSLFSGFHSRGPQANPLAQAAMIVMSARFWANVELAVGIFTPFVKILRRVDGDTPSMGWLYGDMKKAREEVAAVLDHEENKYLPIWKLIDSRWEKKMCSPLHLAGYYLNPHFYYARRVEIEADGRFMSGFVECLSRIYRKDPSTQDHISAELDVYQYQQGLFGKDMAKRQLQNPNLNPVHWWRLNGADTPHLKTMAMKILSLTTSSSACERNWSTFEMVIDALGESVPCASYNSWMVYIPEGEFLSQIGPTEFYKDLDIHVGPEAARDWKKLLDAILPMSAAAMALPPLSLRGDWGVLSTAAARYAPTLAKSLLQMGPQGALRAAKLLRPFSEMVDSLEIKNTFIRNWVDLLSFLLAGVKSDGVLSAEMVYMFAEWYKTGCFLEYPLHGTGAIVGSLVRGMEKFGGRLELNSHVKRILVENGRATGVQLSSGRIVRARKAVVSNASMWDTLNLLPVDSVSPSYREKIKATPQCDSFMHLHLGFDAQMIPEDLGIHHIVVNDWSRGVDAEQNVVLISVPSVLGKELAPSGKHALHAYTPGTEPYGLWEGVDRRSAEYKKLKAERSEVLWEAVERVLGSGFIREKCDVALVGTPLTHQRFLRRNRGTYGPAIKAGQATFPGHSTPLPQLFCCGDSTFPGIGVPAVAASGSIVANTLVPVSKHYELLDSLGI